METLTNASFKNLTKTEQVVLIINSGEELMTRKDDGYIVHLYLLSGFFVEVWYESYTHKIVNVELTDKDSIIGNYNAMNELVKKLLAN
jgi:hypothetical protein